MILILLAVTKPTEESFTKIVNGINIDKDASFLDKVIQKGMHIQMKLTTDVTDFPFFRVAEVDIGFDSYRYLGICGFWFSLDS